jgi:hypothetical protein
MSAVGKGAIFRVVLGVLLVFGVCIVIASS